jgi:hypothetical protein
MSLFPTVIQSQTTYAIDAVQDSNNSYYFIPTGDASGGGGGSTSNLVSPVIVTTAGASAGVANGITINSDNTNNYPYGIFVSDVNAAGENIAVLVAEGNTGTLQLGNTGAANAYFSSSQTQTVIGNTDAAGTTTNLISWLPTDTSLTLNLRNPVNITTQPPIAENVEQGIFVQSNQFDSNPYGLFVNDASSGTSLIQLFAQGDVGQLILGDSGGSNNSYFISGQGGTAIGNQTTGTATNMILWDPTDPALTLKLKNPTVITGPSGEGVIYDSVYNPPPIPPVPEITSNTAPIPIASWNADLTVASNAPQALDRGGLYLVTASVRIGVGVQYNFPAGSILNLTPSISGTQDPYNSMTFFLSSTPPQGAINTTQSGLGFYNQGAVISGVLNQASSGAINLGPGGGIDIFIQQVINQYP